MTEMDYLRVTRAAYDTVAVDYAERLRTELAAKPLDRALLAAFSELVQAAGAGPVADLGCGPGRITTHLHALGLDAFGVDLSPEMVAVARRSYPHLLLAFQAGEDERVRLEQAYGHTVSYDVYRLSPDRIAERLSHAGLVVHARLLREPEGLEKTRQAYLMARKPETS